MKPLKDSRLSLRLPLALKERLARLEERTGIPPTILAVEGLTAICAFYEANGVVTMPFAIVPTPGLEPTLGQESPREVRGTKGAPLPPSRSRSAPHSGRS